MPESFHNLSALESLLFLSGEPITFARLAKALGRDEASVRKDAAALAEKHAADPASGLMLVSNDASVRLATKPENAAAVEALTKSALTETLSKAALEVLSIIAYRAPIRRSEIEAIRGVNCSFTLRNLLLRGLIDREGNPSDARGYVYAPSLRFLETLGLPDIASLPDYASLSQDERLTVVLEGDGAVEIETEQKETA